MWYETVIQIGKKKESWDNSHLKIQIEIKLEIKKETDRRTNYGENENIFSCRVKISRKPATPVEEKKKVRKQGGRYPGGVTNKQVGREQEKIVVIIESQQSKLASYENWLSYIYIRLYIYISFFN